MKIALAQYESSKGDISKNIQNHLAFIELAVQKGVDAIFFPELSLSGYEPTLAKEIAMKLEDERLSTFQEWSDQHHLVIGIGIPILVKEGIQIGLVLFQPLSKRTVYAKQYLHKDEIPFFVKGNNLPNLSIKGNKIALAICYELSIKEHTQAVCTSSTKLYLASVAKTEAGMIHAATYLETIAKTYKIPVLCVNGIGEADDFINAGLSAVWNGKGERIAQLDGKEGLLFYDFTNQISEIISFS